MLDSLIDALSGSSWTYALVVAIVAGDMTSFGLGRVFGDRAVRRIARGERARGRVRWSREQLRRRGTGVVVAARFIPGGRTATTLAAGTLEMPWRRFLVADAVGASLWSCYAATLGWFGGRAFSDSFWKPLALALAIGAVFGGIAELVRRRHERRCQAKQR